MKKKLLIILLILLVVGAVYLNRAYAHIYNYIGSHYQASPNTEKSYLVEPPNTKSNKHLTYVALGDSLTAGVGLISIHETYPYLLAESIAKKESAEVKLINLGTPSATSADVLAKQLPQVNVEHPDFVTLLIGVNDLHNRISEHTFKNNLTAILQQLNTITPHVNIISIPFIGNPSLVWPPFRTLLRSETDRYNSWLLEVAAANHNTVIDIDSPARSLETTSGYYSLDHFHPSNSAHTFWSKIIYAHLNF